MAIAIAARLGWPQPANAQDSQDLPKPSEVVKIDALKLGGALKPGATSQLEVEAEILPGWHINSDHPNSADFIRTTLSVTPPAAVKAGAVTYPPADEIAPAFSGGEKLSVFTGTMKFTVPLKASAGFKPDSGATVAVTLEYQPCNDNICMPPAKVSASASLGSIQPAAAVSSPHVALGRARLVAGGIRHRAAIRPAIRPMSPQTIRQMDRTAPQTMPVLKRPDRNWPIFFSRTAW